MKLFRKGDIAVIAVILAAAAIFAVLVRLGGENPRAVITVDGETVETIDLSQVKEKIIIRPETVPEVVITAENGEIWFEQAECEDKLCVKAGRLSRRGDTAACLPAKTVITITGADVDAVVY
ncbi:MAG: NusG domain II-containing protein [Acutalibacteraceae bacterium]